MIWDSCVPHKFTKFIYLKNNFIGLCQLHITYQKANNIVVKFVEQDMQKVCSKRHPVCIPYFFQKSMTEPIGLE